MATEKDQALVDFLLEKTRSRAIRWEETAVEDQFAATFKGKYAVLVDKGPASRGQEPKYWLTLKNLDGRELLTIDGSEAPQVSSLFILAERMSLNVDEAIEEILSTAKTDNDDIPF